MCCKCLFIKMRKLCIASSLARHMSASINWVNIQSWDYHMLEWFTKQALDNLTHTSGNVMVVFFHHGLEFRSVNISLETSYADWGFSCFSQFLHKCQDITALSHIVFTLNIVFSLFILRCWAFIVDSKQSMKEMKMIGWYDDYRWLIIQSPNFTSAGPKHILFPVFYCLFIACST